MRISKLFKRLGLALVLAQPGQFAYAQSIYITDSVSVALFPQQDLSGEPIQRLLSGTPVEILETVDGVTQIRTGADNVGWVRSSFLSADVPAIIQLDEALKLIDELQEDLAKAEGQMADLRKSANKVKDIGWLKAELQKARERANELENKLKSNEESMVALEQKTTGSEDELAQLKAANEDLRTRLAASELIMSDEPPNESDVEEPDPSIISTLIWSLVAVVLSLGVGFYAGYRWIDNKVKQRFGGIKVY